MQTNRIFASALLAVLLSLSAGTSAIFAQGQQTTTTTNPSPLVIETTKSNDEITTVWQLTVPQMPHESPRLTYERMIYGFSLIEDDTAKLKDFIRAYTAEVKPGLDAWRAAEELVLLYTNGRAATDPVTGINVGPENIRLITTAQDIKKFYGLDPFKFAPVTWGRDPVGECKIEKRSDLLKNAEAIEAQIRRIYSKDAAVAKAWIDAFRGCAGQEGDSETCKDVFVRDFPFIQRNHGANSVGQNERYDPDTTNQPAARMTLYWVDALKTWKGNGWECCGNGLEFYTLLDLTTDVISRGLKVPPDLACKLTLSKNVISSRAEVVTVKVAVTPEKAREDAASDIFLEGKLVAGNSFEAQILGSQLVGVPGNDHTVLARVVVGNKEVQCQDSLKLVFPLPLPSSRVTVLPTPQRPEATLAPSPVKTEGGHPAWHWAAFCLDVHHWWDLYKPAACGVAACAGFGCFGGKSRKGQQSGFVGSGCTPDPVFGGCAPPGR